MSGHGAGVVVVDTAELHELADRLGRAAERLQDALDGVGGWTGVAGLAVGADPMLDALHDLARTWAARAVELATVATGLGEAVAQAALAYETCEGRVAATVCDRTPRPSTR